MATITRTKNGFLVINLTRKDRRKQNDRYCLKYTKTPEPTLATKQFAQKLNQCPICGEKPDVELKYDENANFKIAFRFFCPTDEIHIGYGKFENTLAKAGLNYNRRTTDKNHLKWYEASEKDFVEA